MYRLCKKLAVLHHGKVEVTGEKREIFRNPQTVSAAALTGCENIAAFVVKEQTLYCEEWNLKKRAFLGIRACDIKVEKTKEHADIRCTVESVIESVADWIYFLRPVGAVRTLRMEISKNKMPLYQEGHEIFISISREKILFLR